MGVRQDEERRQVVARAGDDAMSSAAEAERRSAVSTAADQLVIVVSVCVASSQHGDDDDVVVVVGASRPGAVGCRLRRLRGREKHVQAGAAAIFQLRVGRHRPMGTRRTGAPRRLMSYVTFNS